MRDGERIVGGIAYERYPASQCGLVTYLVIAPEARGQGLGERLLREATAALHAAGAMVVFGEVNDPRRSGRAVDETRLQRFLRWGARIVDAPYIQPALGAGLARDRGLALIVLAGEAPLPTVIDGAVVRAFVRELHAITEQREPDDEIGALLVAIPDTVALLATSGRAASLVRST